MNRDVRADIQKHKRELSIKSMYFNRFLFVRYMTALFFFTNMYWLIMLAMSETVMWVVPGIMLILLGASAAEQVRMYGTKTDTATASRLTFRILVVLNIVLMVLAMTNAFGQVFPFLADTKAARITVLIALGAGSLIMVRVLFKISAIGGRRDSQYRRARRLEEIL